MKESAGICIRDESRTAKRIEQDAVGGLVPDPGYGEQAPSQLVGLETAQRLESAFVLDPGTEGNQPPRLLPKETRRTDMAFQLGDLALPHRRRIAEARAFEVLQRASGIGPGGPLHQHGTDRDLESVVAGPPALGAVTAHQVVVELQDSGARHSRESAVHFLLRRGACRRRLRGV